MATARTATTDNASTRSPAGKDGETNLVLQTDGGTTTIQPHVVAKVAGIAVREVDGVHALAPYGAGQAITNLARAVTGTEARDLGVNVEVGKVEAAVDVRIITTYGMSIPAICAAIRENVERRILEITGLRVKETNVEVVDLYFPGDDAPAAKTARVE
jgi:uncharacterized alkaline shock family protein YloU